MHTQHSFQCFPSCLPFNAFIPKPSFLPQPSFPRRAWPDFHNLPCCLRCSGHGTQDQVGCLALDKLCKQQNKDMDYYPWARKWVHRCVLPSFLPFILFIFLPFFFPSFLPPLLASLYPTLLPCFLACFSYLLASLPPYLLSVLPSFRPSKFTLVPFKKDHTPEASTA